jgi:hypothetical protein
VLTPTISAAADALIVNEETGGRALYEKTEQSTTWPGASSGVTIACGYDCGWTAARAIAEDWGDLLPATAVAHLQSTVGVCGPPARALAHELNGQIIVPWEMALAVFHKRDVPKYSAMVARDLENCGKLPPDCYGVLVSLAFNRGDSWNIPESRDPHGRYVEMRAIKGLMHLERFDLIPRQILSMQRLWPQGNGVWKRRAHEAALFQTGLQGGHK